jgi:hypothetical protein
MGRVYLGRSPGGRHVAVKVIRAELAENAEFRARFAREVSAARKVSGIFTAPVVGADPDGPLPWLATSYIAGPSLADAVAGSGPLPAASVVTLAAGLAEGLDAIHSAGVVHRDLKPSNVILAEDGPRLIDFGISHSAEMSALTSAGMLVGSPAFMSPEQAEGREVGPPSDIFSLGAILTFAATGEGPFGDGSSAALLYRVVHSEPDTHRLPGEIRPLIARCLAKDPRHRPTAAELLAELSSDQPAVLRPSQPAIRGLPGPRLAGPARDGTTRVIGGLAPPATERATGPDLRPAGAPAREPTVNLPDRRPAGDGANPPPHPSAEAAPPHPVTEAVAPRPRGEAAPPHPLTEAASPHPSAEAVIRYGPGVPATRADGQAGMTAERVWRTGRPPAPPRRLPRLRQLLGSALAVILLAASGVVLYVRFHHAPLQMTDVVITQHPQARCRVDVTGRITTNGSAGTVSYQWVFQLDRQPLQPLSQSVIAGQHAVYVTVAVKGSGHGSASRRVTLQVLGPGRGSASTVVVLRC